MSRLGIQLAPWCRTGELVALGERLCDVVDIVWVQDQMLARNVYASVAALAHAGCGVGTNVACPVGRNPIEMASAAATIDELLPDERAFVVGLGTGGALATNLFGKARGLKTLREAIPLMRRLWAGEAVPLDDFPVLGGQLGYRPGALAKLTYPVERRPEIVVSVGGPKVLRLIGELADGLIAPSSMPAYSLASFKSGRFHELSGLDRLPGIRPAGARPLKLIFGINVSVSRDSELARRYARRQAALFIGNPLLWPDLEALGLDLESAQAVRSAFESGLGIDGAADRMSAELTDPLVVSGTPEECAGAMAELRGFAEAHGFDEFYLGAPLGPDPAEAAELLRSEVIPSVWPQRLARAS
jgi:alkanesulfonate monooxygenase SsuD/methylene tetrahydromethanopterin reductase-like flavin-dependent oxidoreductase (luciferase family)